MTANQKLDLVLEYLNEQNIKYKGTEGAGAMGDENSEGKTTDDIFTSVKDNILTHSEVYDVVGYLVYTDRYVKEAGGYYFINFKGKHFIENGGYTIQALNAQEARNHAALIEKAMLRYNKWIVRGTWAAAGLALAVLLWYVFAFGYDHHWWFSCACKCP